MVAGRVQHPDRSTILYFLWVESKVSLQPEVSKVHFLCTVLSWSHWSAFFPPTFLLSFLWAGGTAPLPVAVLLASFLLAVTTVSNFPPWILSWCHFLLTAPLGLPVSLVYNGGGKALLVYPWETLDNSTLLSLPLSTPQQRSMAEQSLASLPCQASSPSLCVSLCTDGQTIPPDHPADQ